MSIAILGGAYNPPTLAYEKIIRLILEKGKVDEVWLMPYRRRAFGKFLGGSSEHRFKMAQLLAQPFGEQVKVSDLEIRRQGKSYTVDTLRALQRQHPGVAFDWIIGSDILYELSDWKEIEALPELTQFLCVLRPGYPVDREQLSRYGVQLFLGPRQMPDVSASEVRRRIRLGKSVSNLVPLSIAEYIEANGLYQNQEDSDKELPKS